MARARVPQPVTPTGFVASAVRLPTSSRNMAGRAESWQTRAWNYWETVGELRYVAQWIGNVLSRAGLVAAKREGRLLIPLTEGPAVEAMEMLYGGPQGQAEMLQALGVHLTIAGEAYVTNRAKGDLWNTLASGKVTQLPGRNKATLQADFGLEGGARALDPADLVIRIWTPHPRDPSRPDSPVRPNLSTLAQITAYDAHIAAQVQSRLAGAGILFLSSDAEFPVPEGADPNASPAANFMALLGEAMMTPIADPSDPSALVPIVAMVPTESLGKNEHLKFWSELDNAIVEMRDASIKRLALGMDVPPEVLLGIADANHWNAWLSEESAVKAHLEPRLGTIAFAMTESYLRPAIQGEVPDDELEDYFVLADTSSIRLRPNRSAEAIELYNLGELSGPALRRETGFQPEDAPVEDQVREWILRKLATGSTSPEQTMAALRLLGVDLDVANPGEVNKPPPDHIRIGTEPQLPERLLPERAESERRAFQDQSAGLAAACDVLVYRALERVGNKLRSSHPRTDAARMPTADIYRTLSGDVDGLLAGAWECATDVLASYTDDVEATVATLDFYVRGLLGSHRPHSPTVLGALIACQPRSPLAIGA
jgi:hypothetical protein